tara:strand:- start:29 stop:388 length:360 start_codon:yes stop_codon:yes gene_type:complete
MKKILGIVVLGLLLSGCAYEYEPPKPDFAGTLGSYNYEVYLKYREWGGCEAVLNLKNNNSKIQTVYVELTAFDDKGKNVDMTNFIISNLSKNETAERDSAFTRVSCYDIKKLRISIKDY